MIILSNHIYIYVLRKNDEKKERKKEKKKKKETSLQVPVHGTNLECYVKVRILFKPQRE